MEYRIAVYSADVAFARMLELEFCMMGMQVLAKAAPDGSEHAEIVLLDLDTAPAPEAGQYERMIGFTRAEAISADDAHRRCSMIFHRPFQMSLLRREVTGKNDHISAWEPQTFFSERQVPLALDASHNTVTVNGQSIALSPNESAVMQLLLQNRGNAVSRERIAEAIGESKANKADVYICLLRRKLEAVGQERVIRTVRNQGYRIE